MGETSPLIFPIERGYDRRIFNADNQIGASGYAFDGNGNPTTYSSNSLTFDIENRLTGITSPSFAATYAADDRRASKTAAGVTTYYLYDEDGGPMPLVEETASGATPTYTEAYGVAADGVRARYQPGNQYTVYQWDPSGSYVQSTQQQTYPTFGTHVSDTGPYAEASATIFVPGGGQAAA